MSDQNIKLLLLRYLCGVKPKPKAVNKPSPHSIMHGLDKPGVFTTVSHSRWVATRRGLRKPVSSSPPFKTGLAAFTAPGFTPSILLRDPRAPRSVPSHFL